MQLFELVILLCHPWHHKHTEQNVKRHLSITFRQGHVPKRQCTSNIVKSCDGDGYRALKAIIFHSHPASTR
eukprot:scaffold5767_cov92-Cylindrotheca_fusiformis.AAC.3